MTTVIAATIRERVKRIETTPSIPAVFLPLLKLLNAPPERVKLEEVVKLVSYDNTIAAQCLRVASSPLFGLAQVTRIHQGGGAHSGITQGRDYIAHLLSGTGLPQGELGSGPNHLLAAFAGLRHGMPEVQRKAGCL